jgi:hypothetical protein
MSYVLPVVTQCWLLKEEKFKLLLKYIKQGVFVVECHCITTGSTYDVKHNNNNNNNNNNNLFQRAH